MCLKTTFTRSELIKLYSFDKENDAKLLALLSYHYYYIFFVKKFQKEEYTAILTPFSAFLEHSIKHLDF